MTIHSKMRASLPRMTHTTIGAAIGTVLALVGIAAGLIGADLNSAITVRFIATMTAVGIGVIAFAATIVTLLLPRLRLPRDNDGWVYW